QSAGLIGHLTCSHIQLAARQYLASAVVQRASLDRQALLDDQLTAVVDGVCLDLRVAGHSNLAGVVQGLEVCLQATVADQLAAVVDCITAELQLGAGVEAAVGAYAGFEGTGVVDGLGGDFHAVAGGEALLHGAVAGLDARAAGGEGGALQGDVLGRGPQVSGAGGARPAQLAVGVDADVAAGGGQVAGRFLADAGLGTD